MPAPFLFTRWLAGELIDLVPILGLVFGAIFPCNGMHGQLRLFKTGFCAAAQIPKGFTNQMCSNRDPVIKLRLNSWQQLIV